MLQLCLLQFPLRAPWRPYEMDYSRKVDQATITAHSCSLLQQV